MTSLGHTINLPLYKSNINFKNDFVNITNIDGLICNIDDVIDEICYGEGTLYFYDTCSLVSHSKSSNNSYIIRVLEEEEITIVLSETILIEVLQKLGGIGSCIEEYIDLLIVSDKIKVIFLKEEWLYLCLKEVPGFDVKKSNEKLIAAIRALGKESTANKRLIEFFMNENRGNNLNKEDLFKRFFEKCKEEKASDDDLGEEMALISFNILSDIREKFALISNDRSCLSMLSRTNKNIVNHSIIKHKERIILITTYTIISILSKEYKEDVNKDKLIEICNHASSSGNINVYALDSKFGGNMNSLEKIFLTVEDLVDEVYDNMSFSIQM